MVPTVPVSETDTGVGGPFLEGGALATAVLLMTGAGVALGQHMFRSSPAPARLPADERKDEPAPYKAQDDDDAEAPATPSTDVTDEKVSSTPSTDGTPTLDAVELTRRLVRERRVADENVSSTPSTDRTPVLDSKALARKLERERRAAEPPAVFIEAVPQDQKPLFTQIRSISLEAFGNANLTSPKGGKVAALVIGEEVVGYACYILRPQLASLNVNKLAVSASRRRQGLGRNLIKHLIQVAKRGRGKGQPPLEVVCLSALPTAITFYKACGFREERGVKLPDEDADGDELEEGQLYMEYRLRRRRAK